MKKMKFIALLCAAVIGVTSVMSTQVSAVTTGSSLVNGSDKFKNEWEKTKTYYQNGVEIGSMIFGFDTWAIDEDYVWTIAKECYSKARIKRNTVDEDWVIGPEKGKNKYSKIEVTHKNFSIYYGIEFSATYTGKISAETEKTNVK